MYRIAVVAISIIFSACAAYLIVIKYPSKSKDTYVVKISDDCEHDKLSEPWMYDYCLTSKDRSKLQGENVRGLSGQWSVYFKNGSLDKLNKRLEDERTHLYRKVMKCDGSGETITVDLYTWNPTDYGCGTIPACSDCEGTIETENWINRNRIDRNRPKE